MTPRFVFHPAARDELREALEWYDAQRTGLGDELLDIVRAAIDRVGEFPDLSPEVIPRLRRAVLSRFPYALFYRRSNQPDTIEILAVFHHRRDPATWRRRAAV